MAAWTLHGASDGEEAGARNLVFFRVQWLQVAMKGSSCVRRLRARSFWWFLVLPWCSALCVSSCVRASMRLWDPWWQIALGWLRECCMGLVLGRKPEHETLCFSEESGCRRRWRAARVWGGCGYARFDVFDSPLVFCILRVFVCAWFYALVESLVADRIGMAGWMFSCFVAMCVETCGLSTWCC